MSNRTRKTDKPRTTNRPPKIVPITGGPKLDKWQTRWEQLKPKVLPMVLDKLHGAPAGFTLVLANLRAGAGGQATPARLAQLAQAKVAHRDAQLDRSPEWKESMARYGAFADVMAGLTIGVDRFRQNAIERMKQGSTDKAVLMQIVRVIRKQTEARIHGQWTRALACAKTPSDQTCGVAGSRTETTPRKLPPSGKGFVDVVPGAKIHK